MDVSSPAGPPRIAPTSPRAHVQPHVTETESTSLDGTNRVKRRKEWRKSLTLSLDRKRPAREGLDEFEESTLPPISRLSGHPSDAWQTVKTSPDPPSVFAPTNGHSRLHHSTFRPPQHGDAPGPRAAPKSHSNPNLTRDAFGLAKPNPVSPRSHIGRSGHNSPPAFDWRDVRNRIALSPERKQRLEWNQSFPDLSKHKPKQKVMKFLAEDNSVHLSPSRDRIKLSPQLDRSTPHGHVKDSRASAVKSNVKLKSFDEPFSIRSKIEQFRKWHEEQFMEKLTRLKLETGSGNGLHNPALNSLPHPYPALGFTKILEPNFTENNPVAIPVSDGVKLYQDIPVTDKQIPPEDAPPGDGVIDSDVDRGIVMNLENDARSVVASDQRHVRPVTSVTWKTWRDVNVSDAYCDVDKYIRDNDLMDEEREQWIRMWIANVQSAMGQMEDMTRIASDCSL